MNILSLLTALRRSIVQLFAVQIKFLSSTPMSARLSAAGGFSVAYVFLHFLPDLAEVKNHLGTWSAARWR